MSRIIVTRPGAPGGTEYVSVPGTDGIYRASRDDGAMLYITGGPTMEITAGARVGVLANMIAPGAEYLPVFDARLNVSRGDIIAVNAERMRVRGCRGGMIWVERGDGATWHDAGSPITYLEDETWPPRPKRQGTEPKPEPPATPEAKAAPSRRSRKRRA
jgi:hypothetical protein